MKRAQCAAMTHAWYDTSRAAPPAVHDNPDRDDVYYSVQTGKAGRTIFVSLHLPRGLQKLARTPRLWQEYRVAEP